MGGGDEAAPHRAAVSTVAFPDPWGSVGDAVRMLVVDDDDDYEGFLRSLIGRMILNLHVEAVFLRSVADARRAVEASRVDVVLAHASLPDGTSADVFDHLGSFSPRAARVVLVGPAEPPAASRRSAGEPDVLSKSASISEVRSRIERLVQVRAFVRASSGRREPATLPLPSP